MLSSKFIANSSFLRSLSLVLLFCTLSIVSQDTTTTSNGTEEDAFACVYQTSDETEAIACIGDINTSLMDKDDSNKAIEYVMNKGWWTASNRIIETTAVASVDISTIVHQTASRIRTKLQLLSDALGKVDNAAGIPPAFEWAQSPDSIFLNIKFAHKLDTPATLGCEPIEPIYGTRSVLFKAECKDKRKTFTLNLGLFKEINHELSTWNMASVGRASITLRKLTNATWPRLLSNKNKPGNMHVWWAMKEKYEKELEEWEKKARNNKGNEDNTTTTNTGATPSPAPSTTPEPVPETKNTDSSNESIVDPTLNITGIQSEDSNGTDIDDNNNTNTDDISYFVAKSLKRIARTRQKELDINTEAINKELQLLDSDARLKRKMIDDKARQDKIDIDEKVKAEKQTLEVEVDNKKKEITSRRNAERSNILHRYQDAEKMVRDGNGTPEYLIGTIGGGLHPIPSLLNPDEQSQLQQINAKKELEDRTRAIEEHQKKLEEEKNRLQLGDGKNEEL